MARATRAGAGRTAGILALLAAGTALGACAPVSGNAGPTADASTGADGGPGGGGDGATSDGSTPSEGGGDAGGSGSEAGDDGGASGDLLAQMGQDFGVFQDGGVIPAAGDRGAITVTINGDGSTTLSMAGKNGGERVHVEWTSPGVYALTADVNGDGTVDETMTASTDSSGVVTTVWEKDANLSGGFNWRNTTTFVPGTGGGAALEEVPFGGMSYVTTDSYPPGTQEAMCSPLGVKAGQSCDAHALLAPGQIYEPKPTFCQPPPDAGPPSPLPCGATSCWFDGIDPGGQSTPGSTPTSSLQPSTLLTKVACQGKACNLAIFSVITRGAMACTDTQIALLESALPKAWADLKARVVNVLNPTYVIVLLNVAKLPAYHYGCTIPCCVGNSTAALTEPANLSDSPTSIITTFNPTTLAAGVDPVEEIIIHEWFHAAGQTHIGGLGGRGARDYIYSCARQADGCRAWDAGYYLGICCDASSARDAAMCADATHKLAFGVQNVFFETSLGWMETPNQSLTDGTSSYLGPTCSDDKTGNGQMCQCYLEKAAAYCDQTRLTYPEALALPAPAKYGTLQQANCCESCPGGAPYTTYGLCGTHDATTTCLPQDQQLCSGYAPAPTWRWRSPAAATEVGQATDPGLAAQVCPPIAGCAY